MTTEKPCDYTKLFDLVSFDAGHTLIWPDYADLAVEIGHFCRRTVTAVMCMAAELRFRSRNTDYRTGTQNQIPLFAYDYYGALASDILQKDTSKLRGYDDFVVHCHNVMLKHNWFRVVGPDVEPCLRRLRERGFKLCVTSNSNGLLERDLKNLGLLPCFDFVLDSALVGKAKPHPLIFEQAASRAKTTTDRILHIGDNPVADVKGGRDAGCRTAHYDPQGAYDKVRSDLGTWRNLLDLARHLAP